MDVNLVYDEERFVGSCSLVSLIEAENGYTQELFVPKKAKRPVSRMTREGEHNIGGLGEGTLHLVLKNYISANRENQEIKYGKKYIDVFLDGRAYEVQTRNFSSLKAKLAAFLPEIPVTVIFPAIKEKRVAWTDPETGELSSFRKSPKKESVYSIFNELIYIKDYLSNPNLSFCVFLLAADETKLLCGYSKDRKKGSVRLNRIPTKLFSTEQFESCADFARLLPDTEEFSVKNVARYANITPDLARKMIYCLCHADIIYCTRTEKREKYYSLKN
ncbi:MAG: hypothetical protein IKV97_04630 [Clostridia bacterium]|nr:hypothetical protein [Clostridia bacterium]